MPELINRISCLLRSPWCDVWPCTLCPSDVLGSPERGHQDLLGRSNDEQALKAVLQASLGTDVARLRLQVTKCWELQRGANSQVVQPTAVGVETDGIDNATGRHGLRTKGTGRNTSGLRSKPTNYWHCLHGAKCSFTTSRDCLHAFGHAWHHLQALARQADWCPQEHHLDGTLKQVGPKLLELSELRCDLRQRLVQPRKRRIWFGRCRRTTSQVSNNVDGFLDDVARGIDGLPLQHGRPCGLTYERFASGLY